MTSVLLALGAAVCYGTSDFLGGLLSRHSHFLLVALIGQLASVVAVLGAMLGVGFGQPTSGAVAWGVLAGVGGGIGGLALLRGLARGRMAVVGPVSGVAAAALPAIVGLFLGERLGPLSAVGVLLALPAIWLVASLPEGADAPRTLTGVGDGLLAGTGFAVLYIGIERAGTDAGLWPVLMSQSASCLPTIALWLVLRGRPMSWNRSTLVLAPFPGLIVAGAVLLFQAATSGGRLMIASVLTSLYPAVTVLLAVGFLRESIGRTQRLGLLLCVVAVVAIVTGV